jgi:hypothetical protein
MINYLVLLEASFKDRLNEQNKKTDI